MSPGPERGGRPEVALEIAPISELTRHFMDAYGIRIDAQRSEVVWQKPGSEAAHVSPEERAISGRMSLHRSWPPLDPVRVTASTLDIGGARPSSVPQDRRGICIRVSGKRGQKPKVIMLLEYGSDTEQFYLQPFVAE